MNLAVRDEQSLPLVALQRRKTRRNGSDGSVDGSDGTTLPTDAECQDGPRQQTPLYPRLVF